MKSLFLTGSLLLTVTSVFAQSNPNLPEGWVVKQSISLEKPMGNVFESGAVLCAPDLTNPKNKYNYGYTLKPGKKVEIVEFQVTPDTDGPAGIIALRKDSPDYKAGVLKLEDSKTQVTKTEVQFSGASMDFTSSTNDDGSINFGLAPVATITGTLSLTEHVLKIHVVGSFAQDVEMACELMK